MADTLATPEHDRSRGARPGAGSVVAGRYQLHRQLARGRCSTVWSAADTVLQRRVAVKVLDPEHAADERTRRGFLDRARLTASLEHPVVASTFDTGSSPCVFTVCQLVEGDRVDELVARDGPLPPRAAVALAEQLAEALEAVEQRAIDHGGVDLDDVVVTPDGRMAVTALRPADPAVPRPASLAVGALLHLLLTGRMPDPDPERRVPARRLAPDVPRALCDLTSDALDGAFATAVDVRHELVRLDLADDAPIVVVTPPAHRRRPRDTVLLALVVAVAAISVVVGVLFTSSGGRRVIRAVVPDIPVINPAPRSSTPSGAETAEEVAAATAGGGATAAATDAASVTPAATDGDAGAAVAPLATVDYDPRGDDGRENPSTVFRATDGDTTTWWCTETYRSADFGNLKPGVGIRLELPASPPVSTLRVVSPDTGWAALVLADPGAPGSIEAWSATVGRLAPATGDDRIELDQPLSGGSVLLWFTRLPESGRVCVAELVAEV